MSYIGEIKVEVKKSSVIESLSYNSNGNELKVKLKAEASQQYLYIYKDVEPFTFFGLIGAHSAGKYFNEVIKKHDYHRVYDAGSTTNSQLRVIESKLSCLSDMADDLDDKVRDAYDYIFALRTKK